MSSILKTAALIKSIKMRGFIPESQRTFEAQDFLDIATEKINISLMKQILTARGDYLIYFTDIPLQEGVQSYPIPDRAHGDKLREVSIIDNTGKTKRELTQINLEELSDYQTDYATYTTYSPFYLQNNKVMLLSQNFNSGDKLRMYFYMRPNKLVVESRAATASSLQQNVEIDTISPLSGTITGISVSGVVTSASHGLVSGNKIIISGTDSTPAVDGSTYVINVIDGNTFSIPATVTVPGTMGSWVLAADVITLSSTVFPKHFTTDILYDIVTCKSPNNIRLYNLTANSINNASKTISFRIVDTLDENGQSNISKGDYVTQAEETIVPNVPTEYHPLVAQMVAVHCMESMADDQQKKSATQTLQQMQADILSIVQNRVEGAPKKIKNRSGTLIQATNKNRFRRRG